MNTLIALLIAALFTSTAASIWMYVYILNFERKFDGFIEEQIGWMECQEKINRELIGGATGVQVQTIGHNIPLFIVPGKN